MRALAGNPFQILPDPRIPRSCAREPRAPVQSYALFERLVGLANDVGLLAAELPAATIVGDTRAVAGGLRVMELTPAVARLFGDVFGEHFVATFEAHETSAARDPLVFVAAKALAPNADSSWIPIFRVGDIKAAFSEATAHGAIVGAAATLVLNLCSRLAKCLAIG